MIRRLSLLLVSIAVLFAACQEEAAEPSTTTSTTSTSTTTTVPPTTTTTSVPFSLQGAPTGLANTVESFYDYASGESKKKPAAPPRVVDAIADSLGTKPTGGLAEVAEFAEQPIAVVTVEGDLFLAVKDPKWRIIGGKWPSMSIPAFYGHTPRLVAVVGSDARPGQDVERSRADSIHFVGLDGKGGAAIVGVPRDSYVPIPGYGTSKITASLSSGGPEMMMDTFSELTGLEFDGYLLTGFAGFESLLGEVLGGVTVDVPFAIDDRWAHVSLGSGEQLLDGAQALGFARARKTLPGGDLTRSMHQGVIMVGALQTVRELGLKAVPELLELAEPYLSTDLTPAQLLLFTAMAVSTDPDAIDNVVAPGSPGSAGAASVVFLSSSVDELWADLADGALETD